MALCDALPYKGVLSAAPRLALRLKRVWRRYDALPYKPVLSAAPRLALRVLIEAGT